MPSFNPNATYRCFVTDEVIPHERVEYLLSQGVPENRLTSLNGSKLTHRPRKMLIVDDESNYVMCDHIEETRVYASERFDGASEDRNSIEDHEIKNMKIVKQAKEEKEEYEV